MQDLVKKVFIFEDIEIPTYVIDGKPCWLARDIGRLLGYSDDGGRLVRLISEEWSDEFEKLMRNRLLMGAFRYGLLGKENRPRYDRIGSIRKRIDAYEDDGNLEHLVDIANLCLCLFIENKHSKGCFELLSESKDGRIGMKEK